LSLKNLGIPLDIFDSELEAICDRAEMDLGMVMARRMPYRGELERLFAYAYEGRAVDF
jgi:hypothetical protein